MAVFLLLIALIVAGKRVSYEQSIKSFFADDDPAILDYRKASDAFGDDNFVFVSYDDPALLTAGGMDRAEELARMLGEADIPGVERVESLDAMPLLWKVDDALIEMDKLPGFFRDRAQRAMKEAIRNLRLQGTSALSVGGAIRSADARGLADLKARLTRHPLFVGTLIDPEAKSTALVVRLKKIEEFDVQSSVKRLREQADGFAAKHKLVRPAIVGPPVLLADGFNSIDVDGRRLAIVGMILIGVVTLTATKSLWWALVPLISGWVVWLATEWVLATFNMKLSLSGGPLVAQIIVLTMPAASHLAIHFRDERRREGDVRIASRKTLEAVSAPIFWCAITGAIGYGALVTSNVVPIQQFGWIMGTCTLLAALLVMVISPAAMNPPFRLDLPVKLGTSSSVGQRVGRVTGWVYHHPARIVIAIIVAVVPISLGMTRLSYESNYINAFKPDTRVVRDYQTVESRLGGIGVVELIVPAEETISATTLERFRSVEEGLIGQSGGRPGASHVLSLATVLDPDRRITALPEESANRILATKIDLISSSPQAELLQGFWNSRAKEARILVRLVEQQPASDKSAIFDRATTQARAAFGPETFLTGLSFLMTKTTEGVIRTQWTTFTWSVVGILLMLAIALRGPVLACLAILPTLLSVALVLGLMGWMGIKLDLATALVASVALGLSVDDTFHCLLQFHRYRRSEPFRESLFASYAVTGPGVLLSSIAVAVGFLALRFSEFTPFSNFGAMVAIATAGSTIGNILLLPACLTLGERLKKARNQLPVAAEA
ncbi:efflux RND transporter permease subunit [Tundrisphaera lichenicola]|uniref:efflux RND transporter permease subunit n=1 Tax=Tundrisphaera lichenicola TaxID=2029860 RepID=UPI003EBD0067